MTALETYPVRMACGVEGFDAIHEADTDAVIWNRDVPGFVQSALDEIPPERMLGARFHVPVEKVGHCITPLLDKWGIGDPVIGEWLVSDVQHLADAFASIVNVSRLLLRVEWTRDDACRKFHRDNVTARLICTYRGPGTEFGVANADGAPRSVDRVPTGSAILLKGKKWSATCDQTIVHRSPPIEGTGASRLVVVIDKAPLEPQ